LEDYYGEPMSGEQKIEIAENLKEAVMEEDKVQNSEGGDGVVVAGRYRLGGDTHWGGDNRNS